ncbi:MAG: LicD family protein [Salinicola sp.]|uniref:LicD family protein n=1 Tax=Salinicola sp. TaxID=1978524 RepID=UPI001D34AB65|nr:LicD family protein [Salinicola sp.]NRB56316.1 LicD family protein [Salinicola sp.]
MDSKTYRKLRKLVTNPRLYFEDARLKRQYPGLEKYNTTLKEAKTLFKQGEIEATEKCLATIPDTLPSKARFSSTVALYSKRYADAERYALSAMQGGRHDTSTFREAFYLHQEALRFQGRFEAALIMLRGMPFEDNAARYFRAWRLAALGAKCPEAYESAMVRFTPGDPGWLRSRNHYILLLRDLQLGERAIAEAQLLMQQVEQQPVGQPKTPPTRSDEQKRRWQEKAGLALAQLKEDLAQHDIDFFLVSGTLLGCVREGTILGHDTDIDVGVMPEVNMKSLRSAIKNSRRFKLQEIISENTLYVVHPNGVKIDLFRHYIENEKLYHGGIKCRWWNTPFELETTQFLGSEYRAPKNYDIYLTENYGDWRTPVVEFETFLDTPNMEVTHSVNMSLFYSSQWVAAHRHGNISRKARYETACKTIDLQY